MSYHSLMKAKAHHHPVKLMGCGFVLSAIENNPQKAWDAIRAGEKEIYRIEKLISSWREDSETSLVNKNAGIRAVKVSEELFNLIQRSLKVSELTSGAFDISGTVARYYWNFNGAENAMLPEKKIHELRDLINFKMIKLNVNEHTVFLRRKGMKIGFGGIGKGYAALKAFKVMKSMGIQNGMVNASGDLMCWGHPQGKEQWTINIPDPKNRNESLLEIKIPSGSVVTSGNYENFTLINGLRYSHIVDPRTGRPVLGTKHVSVISPNPELGDALATAISVMRVKEGIALVNRLAGIEAIVIDQNDEVFYSDHLKPFTL